MKTSKAISQLQDLREYCRSMIDDQDDYCTWKNDVKALNTAINTLKEKDPTSPPAK